ncbi:serine/threonine-protein kinase [Nostoc sp. CMAA1605]|uniref:serine/threonine-protein kinase n=1 Tax=Nostoc sp. CMAA1605 TaxID=2055159 RepID=UPI001F353CDD|nr:serine/threonine-protein kinase [Nostoc sp. CMAA1605]
MQIWTPNQNIQNQRFTIQKVIGSGGYGITYSAIEQRTGKTFVLKTLNHLQQTKPDFPEQQQKFVQEAFRLAKCHHPHIVEVHDVFQENQLWVMVMEYIDGQDLAEYIDQQGKLSEHEALCYVEQVGNALEYIHQRGFLHRDVKPNNILLRRTTKEAVLIDFGLAREFTTGRTGSMTSAKTEGYAPLEQYERRGNFGTYTDVYALAATLYSLLTGEVPFPANFRKTGIPLPPPQQFNSQISDRVNGAILQGMALQPQERTPTVLEFRKNLGLVSSGDPEVQLKSSVGMDYRQLRDLLAAGKWYEADEETARVMLAVAQREKEGWLRVEDIDNFPCEDLRIIDQLWVKYSNGRFGFSVQKRIYQSLGGTREYNKEIWQAFGDKVGWRKGGDWLYYRDITFDITAPEAHLPGG